MSTRITAPAGSAAAGKTGPGGIVFDDQGVAHTDDPAVVSYCRDDPRDTDVVRIAGYGIGDEAPTYQAPDQTLAPVPNGTPDPARATGRSVRVSHLGQPRDPDRRCSCRRQALQPRVAERMSCGRVSDGACAAVLLGAHAATLPADPTVHDRTARTRHAAPTPKDTR